MIHIRIDLGRGNIRVPQHLLYAPEIGAVLHQMGRKRMAQRVRCDIGFDPGLLRIIFDQFPKALPAHGLPGTVGKEDIRSLVLQHGVPRAVQISGQCVSGRRPERNDPLLGTVPAEDETQLHIDVGNPQSDQFRHPDTRSIQKFQHRLVAYLLGRVARRLLQQPDHFLRRHDLRNLLLDLRRLELLRQIFRHTPHLQHVMIKSLQRRNISGNSGRRKFIVFQIFNIIPQIL